MPVQRKLTWKRGQRDYEITAEAGDAVPGSETISVNIDADAVTQAEAVEAIEMIAHRVATGPWPIA